MKWKEQSIADRRAQAGPRLVSVCLNVGRVAALALFVSGCGNRDEGDLHKENAILRAQIAILDAQAQDCRATVRNMANVSDMVGSGTGIETDYDDARAEDESDGNATSIGSMGGQSLGVSPIKTRTKSKEINP